MKHSDANDSAASRTAPIPPAVFYILFALADGDKHGYAIMQETVRLSDGDFRMGPATLYTNIQRLLAADLIREVSGGSQEQDARRRTYRLARPGKAALEQELERMRKVLRHAQHFALTLKTSH
jgi:DNA-binding PadR family transcriptional regulator